MSGHFKKDDRVYVPGYGWGVVIGIQDFGYGPSGYVVRFSADPAADGIYLPDWRVFDHETNGKPEKNDGLDPVKSSIEDYVRASGVKLWWCCPGYLASTNEDLMALGAATSSSAIGPMAYPKKQEK